MTTNRKPSPTTTLLTNLKHAELYIDKAIPRARAENSKGNYTPRIYWNQERTCGCMLLWFALESGIELIDELDTEIGADETLRIANQRLFGDVSRPFPMPAFNAWLGCFTATVISIDDRERLMREYRQYLVSEIKYEIEVLAA